MNRIDKSAIDIRGIGAILQSGRLWVPPFQRSYSWEEKQILELFDDIHTARSENREDYFLGSIVISQMGREKLEVVDGQQRLATISILIANIRDAFAKGGDFERVKSIQDDYLFKKDRRTLNISSNLNLNSEDNDYFQSEILKPESERRNIEPRKMAHKKMKKASEIAKKYIGDITRHDNRNHTVLLDLIDYIDSNVKIIFINVPDYSTAFSIFETLNDRGLDLTVSDLLKNFLYFQAGDRLKEAENNWIQMRSYLESVEDDSLSVTYMRHVWATQHGLTRERELFSKIKKQIDSQARAVEFSSFLSENALKYTALLNSDHEIWDQYGPTTSENIRVLNMLNMQQNRPLILACLNRFPVSEVRAVTTLLVNWAIRFIVSGRLGSSGLENHFAENSKKIMVGEIKNVAELIVKMRVVVPTDEEFEQNFSTFSVSKTEIARYLLAQLEINSRNDKQPEMTPNRNQEQVNLEHIMPRKLSENWANIDEEDHRVYYRRVGNLCLIKEKINSSVGNKGYSEKRKLYCNSDLQLTKNVSEYQNWGPKEIDERQKHLAKLAVKTWGYKITA